MARGKYQKKRRITPLVWLLLVLITLGSATGGVAAYLYASPDEPVTSTFTVAVDPTVTVSGTTVTVNSPDCPVYLRVAVAVNKKNGDHLVAGSTSGAITGVNWQKNSDGFFYYTQPIKGTLSLDLNVTHSGDDIAIAAQVIQAVGQTDGTTPIDAVVDAWGFFPQ